MEDWGVGGGHAQRKGGMIVRGMRKGGQAKKGEERRKQRQRTDECGWQDNRSK